MNWEVILSEYGINGALAMFVAYSFGATAQMIKYINHRLTQIEEDVKKIKDRLDEH